ncbi:hypothetical protein ABG768_005624 [Culter alburnus]|uniref:Uncharacterized protein n=1 Tax=Culter alburnus TaxID=194366 RepID=A0AAW1ZUD1_CULAL
MPGDSAFPSGTPSFQLLINYSHISHPILPSLLNMRDLFSSLNSAVRVIVSELPIWTSTADYWLLTLDPLRIHLCERSRSSPPPLWRVTTTLSINPYLAGFSSTHSVSQNRLKVHSSNPYHTTLPFHALQLLHPSICAPHSSQTMRMGLTGIETCSITLQPKPNQQSSDK